MKAVGERKKMIVKYGTDKPRPALKAKHQAVGTRGTSQHKSMKGVSNGGRETPGTIKVRRNELKHQY